MLGILKKKFRKAAGGVKKMENRDAVEATVWGAYSIAYSDGTCDAKEIAVLEKTIAALPAFAPFSGEIAQMSANIRAQYEASPRRANAQALRELADVSGTNDAVDVLCLCIDIADQDGIGAEEQEQLKKIAQALQLPLEQLYLMVIKARLILALVFLVLSVLVDFTSTILSVLSDGALVAVAVTLVWPILKTASKDQ